MIELIFLKILPGDEQCGVVFLYPGVRYFSGAQADRGGDKGGGGQTTIDTRCLSAI